MTAGGLVRVTLAVLAFGCNRVSEEEFDDLADHDDDGYLPPEVGGDDCDDQNAAVNPGEPEVCGDGLDNDCSGVADDSDDLLRFWLDADGDGVGDPAVWVEECRIPEGHVINDNDCDDADPAVGAEEALFEDQDLDGLGTGAGVVRCPAPGYADVGGDCDDSDPAIGAEQTLFPDGDADGWGTGAPVVRCPAPGLATATGDCDDDAAAVNPGALEVTCTDLDEDCDLLGTPDGPIATATQGSFATVQLALDGSTEDLLVCPGVREGGWVIGRPVAIDAVQVGSVFVDAPPAGPTVVVEGGGTVALGGLVISGGHGDPAGADLGGAVANLDPATTLTLSSVVIVGGTAGRGGGIGSLGPVVLDEVQISEAVATVDGGAVWAGDSLTATGGLITSSSAVNGGGIFALGAVTLDGTVIADNDAAERGGGLLAEGDLDLLNLSEISVNTAGLEGGGVHLDSPGPLLRAVADPTVLISANTAPEGAGVWMRHVAWTGATVSANVATISGGGVYCMGPGGISGALVDGNLAAEAGGGIFWNGGGDLWIDGSVVQDNSADVGGGLLGRVYFGPFTLTLNGDVFSANDAFWGGGMALQNITVVGDGLTTVIGGSASVEGGGVALFHAELSGVTVSGNDAPSGGGVAALSDPLFDDAPIANDLLGVIVADNTADDGAGLFVDAGQRLPIDATSSVLRNVASGDGGGAWLDSDGAELLSTGADFGTGADDNTPNDVVTAAGAFELTGAGTWTCTFAGCTP